MKETSSDLPRTDRVRSGIQSKARGFFHRSANPSDDGQRPPLNSSVNHQQPVSATNNGNGSSSITPRGTADTASQEKSSSSRQNGTSQLSSAPSSQTQGEGTVIETPAANEKKPIVFKRVWITTKKVLFHSWLNVLLIFVPIGIAVKQIPGMHAGVVFSMNCIAIIPLAGLLSYATESVARKLGDTIGALLNVTFGNAVELIIL
jgi:Ca2+:H+ antiporter